MLMPIFLAISCVFVCLNAQAETIYLKSGKVLEASILEENEDYIKIDFNGNPLYYQKKYISSIEKPAAGGDNFVKPGSQAAGSVPEDYFRKGLKAAANGDFLLARQEFRRGILDNGNDYNIPAALSLLDDFDSGKAGRAYVLDMFNGLFSLLNNEYKQAIPYFRRVLEIKPDNMDALYNLGVCYYSLDDFKQAIVSFKSILDIRPEDPEVYGLLGNAYYLSGQTREAKESFVLARELFRKALDTASANEIDALLSRLFKDPAHV
jgi:tetratricopeptide (TPR) repeat protein